MATAVDTYHPFDAGNGADVLEDRWRQMARLWAPPGVDLSYANKILVYGDSTGRQVKVPTGRAWIDGFYAEVTSEKTIALTTNTSGNPRIDRIVLQVDPSNNICEIAVVEGTPAATPAAPALTQSATGTYQIPLAQVAIADGYSTVAAADVTDERYVAVGPSRAGDWAEIGRTTQTVAGDTLSCTFPLRKFLKVVVYLIDTGGTIDPEFTLNSDSGSNYAYRSSTNGGADTSVTSDTNVDLFSAAVAEPTFAEIFFTNFSGAQVKLFHGTFTREGTSSAGTQVDKQEMSGKWVNTTTQIKTIAFTNGGGAGDYAIGSELIVYGHD